MRTIYIKEQADVQFAMNKKDVSLECPFKIPAIAPNPGPTFNKIPFLFFAQTCNSNCPHFEYSRDEKRVHLSCGKGTTLEVITETNLKLA